VNEDVPRRGLFRREPITLHQLRKAIGHVLAFPPDVRPRLADLGGTVLPGSPADFGKLIADDTEKWGKVVKTAGIRAE
jgi:hypothetical protein